MDERDPAKLMQALLRSMGIRAQADRRPPEPEPPPALPCPRCGRDTLVRPAFYRDGERELPDWLVTIRGCGRCQMACAHIEGIADTWRETADPDWRDKVVQDGWDGLRLKRWLEADDGFEVYLPDQMPEMGY